MSMLLGPLTADGHVPAGQQTWISAFLISAHGAHARQLAAHLPASLENGWQVELHAQFCSEGEFLSLLARSTSWTLDPMLPLLATSWELAWLPKMVEGVSNPLQGLLIDMAAFGLALHSVVRPAVILPERVSPLDPFVLALQRIEMESGRLMQGEILYLKDLASTAMCDPVSRAVAWRRSQVRREWENVLRRICPLAG